ncbi:VOC family protein [Nocardioides sp. LHG3406-4]|uniref:VOC family protein n=1 Tax=Nocardioides sp. LHG3406-4 TaxID=2804575 RepID=UPI003CF512CA
MSSTLVAVTFDAHDPAGLASFWGSLLDRQVVHEAGGARLPADDTQVGLRFVAASSERSGPNRLHLHLTSTSLEDQEKTVAMALSLGGRHLDVGQLPEEEHVVLGDPEGNEFCVIEPGNNFLADCGHLGEVTCEGSREVGLFWSEALGWPVVWDRDGETAVQSPVGGTKISWGGPPVVPKQTRNRQRFDLAAGDPEGEVARLVALGATRLGDRGGSVELADPDGNEFCVAPRR